MVLRRAGDTGRRLRRGIVVVGTLALVAGLMTSAGAYPRPGITDRVSVASDEAEANSDSIKPAISADGRYVAFGSTASDLATGDTNEAYDVFVRNRATGTTERVSVASDGTEANGHSVTPAISADGRHVTFSSTASNLVQGDTNEATDVFVHDRATGITERVSVGFEAGAHSFNPAISADGRHVVFASAASDLVTGDTNEAMDVFVHDRATQATQRISVASDGTEANAHSYEPAISGDGGHVAFFSTASNLVPADTNEWEDVFVHDRATGATQRISVASDGAQANAHSFNVAIDDDGRHVAFRSFASNLVPADTNGAYDVFVHDRATGTTERVSVASDGTEANSYSSQTPAISRDGRHVAFWSDANNLVPADTNGWEDMFVHDRATGATGRVSVASDGTEADSYSDQPAISANGEQVAFASTASNLVPGDTNESWDIFVHERGGPLGVGGTPSVLKVADGLSVSGRATFSGATLAGATDPDDDGAGVGPVRAADVGAELTEATLIYRPEQEDLLLRLDLSSVPSDPAGAGLPGVLYGAELRMGETRYEVRAFRAGVSSSGPRAPYVALYRCAPDCTEHASLTGSFGTTGEQVRVSVPLSSLGTAEGTELTGLRAFTAAGEAAPGALLPLDEVALSSSLIPASRVELGIAPAATPEDQVAFTVEADLLEGSFSGTVPTDGLPSGNYRVWTRACLGDACGPAAFGEVAL